MATGDIKSVSIEANGWIADVTVEGVSTGGTYDFGLGTNNEPTSAKIVFSLTSEGYSTSGVLGTIARTVYGVPTQNPASMGAVRKADPNDANPDETVSGSDVVIKIALSEYIYNDDTSITVDFAAGWYTQGGNASLAVSDLAVTNNSTLDYPRVIANWGVVNRKVVTENFDVEFLVFHGFAQNGKQVACVKITATDQHAHSVTTTLTDMSVSTLPDYAKVLCYKYTVDVSTMTDGDLVTIQAQAYPWVGDADSIIDTNDGVNTFPTSLYVNLVYRLDKAVDHGHACVSTDGNDGTGAVYASQALAEAGNAYLTVAAAMTALQSYHNTNSGHNDAGGGTIYLDEATWTLNSTNGGTLAQWVTVTRQTGTTKANVIFGAAGTGSSMPTYLRLYDINHDNSSSNYFTGNNKCFWLDTCTLSKTSNIIAYTTTYNAVTWCSGSVNATYGFRPYSTTNSPWALIRGNDFSATPPSVPYVVIGNHNIKCQDSPAASTSPITNNGIFAFNINDSSSTTTQISIAQLVNIDGFAVIQNLLLRFGSITEPMMYISGDGTITTTNNIVVFHNTFAGARCNMGYNDIASGGPYLQINWHEKNNIWSNWNNKDDTYGNNADATGGWAVGYHVGFSGNHYRESSGNEWFGEFYGLYYRKGTATVPLDVVYVDNNSSEDANTSGGDYHLTSSSPPKDIAHELILAYDLEGNARRADGAAGVYEAGTTYNDSTTETGAGSETSSALTTAISDIIESGSGAEVASALMIAISEITEAATGQDIIDSLNTAVSDIIESGAGTDATNAALTTISEILESGTAQEISSAIRETVGDIIETGYGQDVTDAVIFLAGTIIGLISEIGTGADSASAIMIGLSTLSDSGEGQDVSDGAITYYTPESTAPIYPTNFLNHFFGTQKTYQAAILLSNKTYTNGAATNTWIRGDAFTCLFWRGSMSDRLMGQRFKADVAGVIIAKPDEISLDDIPQGSRITVSSDSGEVGTFSVVYADNIAGQDKVMMIPVKEIV